MAAETNMRDVTFSAPAAKSDRRSAHMGVSPGKIISAVLLLVIFVVWEMSVRAGLMPPFLLPAPSRLLVQFGNDVTSPAVLREMLVTITEIACGFAAGAIVGIALGAVIALVPMIEEIVWPYIITLQTIPKVAVAPLLIIWFGFGIESKILIVALICFFPILVNAVAGFKSTDSRQVLLMESMDATKWQIFRTVRLPNAVPFLIAGFQIAVVLAVIGAVIGEFLGASAGLGALLVIRQANMDVTGVFSVLVMLSIIGLSMNLGVGLLSRKVAFWSDTSVKL
ncbi:MAG: ABC transporter permease [Bradyrhizobium sp.]|nr:ABC transporter permease [Bradyrhizobium sp.]